MEVSHKDCPSQKHEDGPAIVQMWKYLFSCTDSAAIKCVIELKIADIIESYGSPMTLSQLSSTLNCSSSCLYRILRYLVHRGIFRKETIAENQIGYAHTPLSRLLTTNDLFNGVGSLVDVGGGNGATLNMFVKACPWLRGINFDLPHVVSASPNYENVQHVGGDMFHSVPKADVALLKRILHDWDDEECIKILKNCKEAIPKDGGKVIIVEAIIEEEEDKLSSEVGLKFDLLMMIYTNKGKERTREEWEYVINSAGFSRYTITPIQDIQSVFQCFP